MEDAFLDKVKINANLPRTADYNPETDAIPRAFEDMKNHPAITEGLVDYDDFLFTVNFMDPYRQVDKDTKAPTTDPITARNILLQERARIQGEKEHTERLEILSAAEGAWGTAYKNLGGKAHKNERAFEQMQNITQFAFTKSVEGVRTFDAEGAVKALDRTLVQMIEDADNYRFGGLWQVGITRASDIEFDFTKDKFNVETSPVDLNRKKQMDNIIGVNYKARMNFDNEARTAFLQLKQARERIYEGITKGLFEIKMGAEKEVSSTRKVDNWEE